MYYVVYRQGEAADVIRTWAAAQEVVRRRRALCRKFGRRDEAERFVASLEQQRERSAAHLQTCYTDGAAALHLRASGAAYFGPGDARNTAALLTEAPFTAPRAEFWAAVLALRAERPLRIITDSELLYRCFLDNFPRSWANQDLIGELRKLSSEAGGSVFEWTPGHAGLAGNEAAHEMCTMALREACSATLSESGVPQRVL
jgi:ribonuclease HI